MTEGNRHLRVADFDFHLPEELIAQQPPAQRGASRMLVVHRDPRESISETQSPANGHSLAPEPVAPNEGFVTGHDFSRAENAEKNERALAPAQARLQAALSEPPDVARLAANEGFVEGHDFSRADQGSKNEGALAPAKTGLEGTPHPPSNPPPFEDRHFADFPSLLNPGDLLVLNDSRVIPARLFARRATARGKQEPTAEIEVLLTAPTAQPQTWRTLVRPGKKVRTGDWLEFANPAGQIVLSAEVLAQGEFGERTLRFSPVPDFYALLDAIGHMPLPPYIHREDSTADRERYQTIYSAQRGSVAAPTAGLHFTPEILAAIEARGAEIAKITLHVGLGTFAPLRVENVADIHLHTERYTLPPETAAALNRAKLEGRRVVAVGTTTVRTLEHCASTALTGQLEPHSGETSIFISPGYQFRLVDALLTNFHLPQSSLLMLVSAFAGPNHGREKILAAYAHAVQHQYKFFSYGDCMFLA